MNQGRYKKRNNDLGIARVVLVMALIAISARISNQFISDRMLGNARLTMCQSNMKLLGLALDQYAQDSDGTLPSLVNTKQMWRETLYPYVKSVGIYRCPDNHVAIGSDSPSCLSWSYAANRAGWSKDISNNQVIRLVDERGDDGPEWDMTKPMYAPPSAKILYLHRPPHPFFYHPAGTLNVLLADGHVKRLAPMATLKPVNLWTRDNRPFAGQDMVNAQAILKHAENE